MENKQIRRIKEECKARNLISLLGGITLGSLLTAYCWIPSNISVRDINGDGRTDIGVQQINGVKRNYLQEQNETYNLDTKYIDELLTIIPW